MFFLVIRRYIPPMQNPEIEPNINDIQMPIGPRNAPINPKSSISPTPTPSLLVAVLKSFPTIHKIPYPPIAPKMLSVAVIVVKLKKEKRMPTGISHKLKIWGITIARKSVAVANINAEKNKPYAMRG